MLYYSTWLYMYLDHPMSNAIYEGLMFVCKCLLLIVIDHHFPRISLINVSILFAVQANFDMYNMFSEVKH